MVQILPDESAYSDTAKVSEPHPQTAERFLQLHTRCGPSFSGK